MPDAPRSLTPQTASDSRALASEDGATVSLWFLVSDGWLIVTMARSAAEGLQGQIADALSPEGRSPPRQ